MFWARLGSAALMVTLVASCASCADGSGGGSPPIAMGVDRDVSSARAPDTSSPSVCGSAGQTGFAISLPAGITGYPDARAAVRAFETGGQHPGYGSADTQWTVTAGTDGDAFHSADGVSLTVIRLDDGTWIVDAGEACG